MKSILEDFKKFLLKGNLVTTAVALVIALVFTALVKAFVADLITPIIAMIFGNPDFSSLSFTINSSHFYYGDFLNNVIAFVATAFAIFFFVVKPYEYYEARRAKDDPTIKECPECTLDIPVEAKRCPECTAVLSAAAA
jgi:large conductance mechanosensitive channel